MTRVDAQVLVVGAGPTGLTLAHVLADHGVDVIVVDKAGHDNIRSRPWSVALNPSSARVLHSIDARTVRNSVLLAPPQSSVDVVPAGRRRSSGRQRWTWSAASLDEVTAGLYDAAVHRLDVRPRHAVQHVAHRPDHAEARLQTEAGTAVLRARFVVGCDGGTSVVTASAGISSREEIRPDRLVVHADVSVEPSLPSLAEWNWTHPAGDVAALPVPSSTQSPGRVRWHVSVEMGAGELCHPRGERHAVADAIATRTGLPTDPVDVRLLGFVPEEVRTAERRWLDRSLLVGDAAHRDTRLGAHAVDRGITDAVSLGPKLARVVNGEAADAILRLYDVSRDHGSRGEPGGRSSPRPFGGSSFFRRRLELRPRFGY